MALLLAAALGLGCASIGNRLEPPEVSLVDIEPLPSNTFEQRFHISLRIVNPNAVALNGEGVDLTVELNDRRLARALGSEAFTIPALGNEVLVLVGSTNLLDLFRQIVALPEAEGRLDYVLHGRILLAGPTRWIRFSHEGSLIPESSAR
jgi:LEA14-like dessication related protein